MTDLLQSQRVTRDMKPSASAATTRPPAMPRSKVAAAMDRRGDGSIPQFFQPVPLFFRNHLLWDFFETWPCDLIPVGNHLDPESDLRDVSALTQGNAHPLHGSSAVQHALDDWSDAGALYDRFCRGGSSEWRAAISRQIAEEPDLYHVAVQPGCLFEPVYLARGMENFFIDLYENRQEVELVLDRLMEFVIMTAREYAALGVDCLFTSDDWGSQQSLFIAPSLWREVFLWRYRAVVEGVHEAGMHIIFHSDGNLDAVFPDLVSTGIDAFHPLQPQAMDEERWLADYKGQVTFLTGVDSQFLPFASPSEVRDHVHRSVERFRGQSGGFILGPTNAITMEVPAENLEALHHALLEYR